MCDVLLAVAAGVTAGHMAGATQCVALVAHTKEVKGQNSMGGSAGSAHIHQ